MATLVTEQGIVHYESYGRGRPVLLLHGWLGSWMLWRKSIEILGREFRTYALDFFGFGESADKAEEFTISAFTLLVQQFMDRLGIVKAPLVGHSMGGTVSLSTAVTIPDRIVKVIVIGSPVQGSSLNILLKASGNRGFASVIWTFPNLVRLFLRGYSYFMARDGHAMSQMISSDISKVTVNSFFESIGNLRQTDLRQDVESLRMPVLGIYGKKDIIVHPNQGRVLGEHVSHSRIEMFDTSGHFPMLDEPDRFHLTVSDFLNNG